MPRCSLRARLRPGRAHAPEGGPLSEPEALLSRRLGRRLQRGFRIIPGSAPKGVPPRRAGFNAPLEFLTGFTYGSIFISLKKMLLSCHILH